MDKFARMFGVVAVLFVFMVSDIHAGCVDDLKAELKPCFDQLKNNMQTEAPSDVNNFFCGISQKDRLDCVIKNFNKCPEFAEESFIEDLKHSSSDFKAKDLFHVKSADEFCKCAPTFPCLEKVDITRLSVPMEKSPWPQIANQEYICGLGIQHIDCVAKSLPNCEDFLQYKHNESLKTNNKPPETHMIDIGNFIYAATYADNNCREWPEDKINHECTTHRAGWSSVSSCVEMADNLVSEADRTCGMRTCIERAMFTCPKNDMAYFIDAVNIFSEVKIDTKTCTSSADFAAIIYKSVLMLCLLCLIL